ncbi:hypothetical protein [Pseudonocardia sp. NPDC049154]|uniref:hypothetical protein n=1 Tax=Pseudonocardia sp. NPDC049154 TaxID=3155501 RepID=UPI00340A4F18
MALLGALVSPLTVLVGVLAPVVDHPLLSGVGITVTLAGFVLVVVSQTGMGARGGSASTPGNTPSW